MGIKTGLAKKREAILRKELRRLLTGIKKLGVMKVILFGSVSENKVGKSSDIDLAIIKKTTKKFSERTEELYKKLKPRVAVDFFVYTPEEIEKMKKTNYFIRRMLERGRIIYEA